MPTYSYVCTACDHRFDAQQSFADVALSECPRCEGRLRKLFGNVGVVFKGPGFYRTDARAGSAHGSKKSGRRSSGDSSDSSSPAASPAASTSAPAASLSGASDSGSGSGSAHAAAASA